MRPVYVFDAVGGALEAPDLSLGDVAGVAVGAELLALGFAEPALQARNAGDKDAVVDVGRGEGGLGAGAAAEHGAVTCTKSKH